MNAVRKAPRGFTLIEVLVTVVLVSVAIVGVFGGIRAIQNATAKAQTADLLQRLAAEKVSDLKLLSDPSVAGTEGDFTDRGYPDITWALQANAASITDLTQVTVTVTRGPESQAMSTLLFVRPQTSTSTSTTATQGAGT